MRWPPSVIVGAQKNPIGSRAALGPLLKYLLPLIGKDDVSNFPLAKSNRKGTAIAVKALAFKAGEFGVTAAGKQSRLNQFAEVGWTYIDQPPAFSNAHVAYDGLIDSPKRLDLPPGAVAGNSIRMKGAIECRLQHRENSVGGRLAGTPGIVIISGFARGRFDRHPLAADAFRLGGQLVAPTVEAICGQSIKLDGAEFRQDPGIENIFCPLHGGWRFLGSNFAEVVLDRICHGIGAVAKPALGNLSLTVRPTLCVVLGLPIVENLDAIGFQRVIGRTDRFGRVDAFAAVVARDPRACDRAAIIAEPKTLRDLCKRALCSGLGRELP
jgi:hypothetical protein